MLIASFIIFFLLAFGVIWLLTRRWGDNSSQPFNTSFDVGPLLNKTSELFVPKSMHSRIVFNGTEYSSPDQMPPDVRQAYDRAMGSVLADADRNGIPDIFEGKSSATVMHTGLFTNPTGDPSETLKELQEMRDSGLITPEEFEAKKTEILNRM